MQRSRARADRRDLPRTRHMQHRAVAWFTVSVALILFAIFTSKRYRRLFRRPIIATYVHWDRTILIYEFPVFFTYNVSRRQKCEGFDSSRCLFMVDIRTDYGGVDAVVVHHPDHPVMVKWERLFIRAGPPLWIWWNMEPRALTSDTIETSDGFFHATASFRHDSDIVTPYGRLVPWQRPLNLTFKPRRQGIAWLVSHYEPQFRRVKVVRELRKYMDVDIYGRLTPDHFAGVRRLPPEDMDRVLMEYKFYLAFESEEQEDYITEKLWINAMANQIVPVVLGPTRECYERHIPGESFIHVDDFKTVRELADFLKKVGDNYSAWSSYLQVHNKYEVKILSGKDYHDQMCSICKYVLGAWSFNWSRRWNISGWYK